MLISLSVAGVLILVALIFLLAKNSYQSNLLKKRLVQVQFELMSEKQKQQIIAAELADLKEKFNKQVLADPLTGLISRQVFEDRLAQTLKQSARYQLTFAVMSLDIDEFKMINDVFGHEVGDELLQEVAKRLQGCMRQLDSLSRFSGDNFVLVLPQLTKAEAAAYVAQRFLEALAQPFHIQGQDLYVTASIGIAIYPADGNDPKMLLQNAESAVNQLKLKGRNIFQFYHQATQELSRRELILSSGLRNPEVCKDFLLYYQPQIDVKTKKRLGVAAVLHWQHPDFGLIPVTEFFRLIEQSGKNLALGEWMFRHVLTQFCEWQKQGVSLQQVSISVSLRQLEGSHFIYKISQILQELKLDQKHLVLEVAEDALSIRQEQLEKTFQMLKHLGVKIAIAHFGTGHLSLQHLKKLPIDYLKIDASLIDDIATNKESEAVIKVIMAITKNLPLTVVAEGVAREEQQKLLEELGCQVMQGPLFGPLLLGEEVVKSTEVRS